MGNGYRNFAAGEVLTSANTMNYLMKQAVMAFANAAGRDAAITSPEEGMVAVLRDTDALTIYNGASWETWASYGNWTSFTPTWSGSTTNPTLGNGAYNNAYQLLGSTVNFRLNLTMGSTTTYGSGAYGWTLPLNPKNDTACAAVLVDASATQRYAATAWLTNASGIFRLLHGGPSAGVAGTVPFTFAQSDQIIISGTYEWEF